MFLGFCASLEFPVTLATVTTHLKHLLSASYFTCWPDSSGVPEFSFNILFHGREQQPVEVKGQLRDVDFSQPNFPNSLSTLAPFNEACFICGARAQG